MGRQKREGHPRRATGSPGAGDEGHSLSREARMGSLSRQDASRLEGERQSHQQVWGEF